MRFIDLFAGVGGFHLGLERASNIEKTQSKRDKESRENSTNSNGEPSAQGRSKSTFSCVWANEWDKYAGEVYQKRFPNTPFFGGDIREVQSKDIPDHDLLVGGFPCQAFSIAGKRRGFEETRGTLFFEIARIAKEKRPRLLLLENVKGLLSHDKGRTFGTILRTLDEIGYDAEWEVLNSKNFGVPQNRERVFIVGHLRGKSSGQVFPLGQNDKVLKKTNLEEAKLCGALTSRYWKMGRSDTYVQEGGRLKQVGNIDTKGHNSLWGRVYNPEGIATNLNAKGGGLGAKTGLYAFSSSQRKHGVEARIKEGEANTLTGCSNSNKSMNFVIEKTRIRRLTPVECERLQGFPDDWIEGLSDTQRYKCMGNTVTVNVVQAIGEKLAER
jgi:DNA (cytosine-5)-methyltransferase 1|tara:strand:- start:1129 stop:2277 length:1149 start_codon:yes stop_codon:yes gene_type:complete